MQYCYACFFYFPRWGGRLYARFCRSHIEAVLRKLHQPCVAARIAVLARIDYTNERTDACSYNSMRRVARLGTVERNLLTGNSVSSPVVNNYYEVNSRPYRLVELDSAPSAAVSQLRIWRPR